MVAVRNGLAGQEGFLRETETATATVPCPPAFLEYLWYASLIYAMLGGAWGIVIPSVGGVMLILIAAACFLSLGYQAFPVYQPISWALYTGILLIVIQVIFHEENPQAWSEGIAFVEWIALLIIAQSFTLRPGFLQRFALVALVIGIATLPFVKMYGTGGMVRAGAAGTGIANPNSLGMWFGFCAVYFIFWGLQCRNSLLRTVSWATALVCLYIVMLTVSRAPLLAILLACIVGFRSALKRSFIPLLALSLLIGLVYMAGLFDEEIGYYTARGAEESGRGRLWPLALERILNSPFIGVGLGDIMLLKSSGKGFINPHNGLLHIALGGGIVPLIFFLAYLTRVVMGSLHIMRTVYTGESALLSPLVMYAMFEIMMLDMVFMSPWTVVVFALVVRQVSIQKSNEFKEVTIN